MEETQAKFTKAFWQMLKVEKRCTQQTLAKEVKKSQSYISAVLNQERLGSMDDRENIARYFGYTYSEFLELGAKLLDQEGIFISAPLPERYISKQDKEVLIMARGYIDKRDAADINKALVAIQNADIRLFHQILGDIKGIACELDQKGAPVRKPGLGIASGEY